MKKTMAVLSAILCVQGFVSAAQASTLQANVDIRSQTMTVSEDGVMKYRWKVSTARKGYVTPAGSYQATWLSRDHHSNEYDNAPMPYAVFFYGGYAVHATNEVKHLGQPASHGCVRLQMENAATFFSMARDAGLRNTRIVIND